MTTYQVMAGGAVVSEHGTEDAAVAACKAIEPQYDSWAAPSVLAKTTSGTYESTQTIYPTVGNLYAR